MVEGAVEQVSQSREIDVRVRADEPAGVGSGNHLIPKDEGANQASLAERQGAQYAKAAQVAAAGQDDHLDIIRTLGLVRRSGINQLPANAGCIRPG